MSVTIIFLGLNDAGERIYEWLCEREDAVVQCLVTEQSQLPLVEQLAPDLVVSAGFGHLVPGEILSVPPKGCVNVHPALLPYNRGMSPNVWSIVEGTPAGVTIHYMDETLDTGPIIAQREVDTRFSDTGKDLHYRLEDEQVSLFKETWPAIRDGDPGVEEQSETEGTYHDVDDFTELCKLDPDEEMTVRELLDRLRALTFPPFENAYLDVDGERYYVDVEITPADEEGEGEPAGRLSSY